jgi:surface antigen
MTRSPAALFVLALLGATIAAPAFADPPSHAPAHGWRKKNDPYYQGYSGKKWERDYGILEGRCDAKSLGETLGKSVGGSAGSKVGSGEVRDIAILAGEVLGEAIGRQLFKGSDIKDVAGTDRACLAQALELAKDGQMVAWTNPVDNARYLLTPQRAYQRDGRQCREFTLAIDSGGRRQGTTRSACTTGAGAWEMR